MTAVLHVLDGGLQTTVQDAGRMGMLALGIPRSGALDPLSWRLANRIAGNAEHAAALEVRTPGPAFRVEGGGARIVLAGTDAGLAVERGEAVHDWPSWRAVDLRDGDVVRIAPFADTAVAYLAVAGGFALPEELGSRSTFLRGGIGGFQGRALRAGDRLKLARSGLPETPCLTLLQPPRFPAQPVLRAIPGPQEDHFSAEAIAAFYARPFAVTRDLDRMGIRLDGPELASLRGADIVSDATVPGAIQVPGSSRPILLLNDCQTTGGYPKIAVVISTDLGVAGRLVPGTEIRFRRVGEAEAAAAREAAALGYAKLLAGLVPVRET